MLIHPKGMKKTVWRGMCHVDPHPPFGHPLPGQVEGFYVFFQGRTRSHKDTKRGWDFRSNHNLFTAPEYSVQDESDAEAGEDGAPVFHQFVAGGLPGWGFDAVGGGGCGTCHELLRCLLGNIPRA